MGYLIDRPFEWLEPKVGAPPDNLKLIFVILTSYPLAHLYLRIPSTSPNAKHVFSIALSSFYLLVLFRLYFGWLQIVGDAVVTWGICKSGWGTGRDGNGRGQMPWLVFGVIMGHLLLNHCYRELFNIPPSTFEITAPQMVLAMKLITFAWNVEDGRVPADSLDSEQLSTRLKDLPGLLPFLGHCLFFPSVLTGPGADYASYKALVDGTLFAHPPATTASSALANKDSDSTSSSNISSTAPRLLRPSGRKNAAYTKLLVGLGTLAVYALYGYRFGYEHVLDKGWWRSLSLVRRYGFVQMAGLVARCKYYAIWSMCEGACILTGIGFNGYDPKTRRPLWDRVTNLHIGSIETAQSYKVLFDSWNCRANVWLRDTIYKRITPKGKKPGVASTLMTFLTSAVWHGISPGYYLAFITAGFCTSLGRPFRHLVRPFFMPSPNGPATFPKGLYDFIGWVCVQSTLNYLVAAFMLLGLKDCIRAWNAMGWYGHVMIGSAVVFFRYGGRRWLVKANERNGHQIDKKKATSAAVVMS